MDISLCMAWELHLSMVSGRVAIAVENGSGRRKAGVRNTITTRKDDRTGMMKRILLVDDETFFLQMMERALRSPSTEVTAVETGAAALREIAANPFEICFLDICLPDLSGIEVLKRITEISSKTKVIMMTAGKVNDCAAEIVEKYAYMFLSKPFDLLQLRMLIQIIADEAVPAPGKEAALFRTDGPSPPLPDVVSEPLQVRRHSPPRGTGR